MSEDTCSICLSSYEELLDKGEKNFELVLKDLKKVLAWAKKNDGKKE